MGFFSKLLGPPTECVDLDRVHPIHAGPDYKFAGRFRFYGTLDEGEPQYDLPPPPGVVRVQYKYEDRTGENMGHVYQGQKGRVGFFQCSRFEFSSFLHAWANWNSHTSWGDYDAEGNYPNAKTLVVPRGKRRA